MPIEMESSEANSQIKPVVSFPKAAGFLAWRETPLQLFDHKNIHGVSRKTRIGHQASNRQREDNALPPQDIRRHRRFPQVLPHSLVN
jgi:hypothetical protein